MIKNEAIDNSMPDVDHETPVKKRQKYGGNVDQESDDAQKHNERLDPG